MNQTILVVDDDQGILQTLQDILSIEGFPVKTARDGIAALNCIDSGAPDLILLDMRMPNLDGWGFASELRTRGMGVPVLVMTAAQNGLQWAKEINASGYVSKPFDIDRLLSEIQQCLDNPGRSIQSASSP